MYNQGIRGTDGTVKTRYRGKVDMQSMVNNRARVYKGGGWKDRAYWLAPGARRYLDEDQRQDDLGFRCAMDRIGSPTGMGY